MRIPVVIPYKPINPKTRLSCILTKEERQVFACMMLRDVVDAVKSAGCSPLILATAPLQLDDVPVEILEEGLNETINKFCAENDEPLAIVMADLALADRSSILSLLTSGGDLAIAPGRGGGTNAIYIRSAKQFQAQYYGMSYEKHLKYGIETGLMVKIIDSFRLYCDIDEQDDLIEVLIHNRGNSHRWLVEQGFEIEMKKSRIGVKRPGFNSSD
ncbi:MAG: 2-phospho-L-lactate guanylyltransferase [Methanomicrobiales archaeon]|nr:2-phospho-L-lactate guanylyltransferase [Methanomicrobiales archaeon]